MRNEHIDAGKDYGIDFRVQLGPEERRKYAEQIRASGKFRNDNAERDNTWQPTGRGFKFFRAKDGVFYNIEVDTVSGLVRYNELG